MLHCVFCWGNLFGPATSERLVHLPFVIRDPLSNQTTTQPIRIWYFILFFFWGDILGISTMVNHHHLSPPLGRRFLELFPTTLGKSKHITGLVKPNSTLVSATFEACDLVGKKRSPSKIVSLKRPLWEYGTSHGKILKGKDASPVHFGYFHRSLSTAMSQSLMFHAPGWSFWNMEPEFQRAVPFFFEHVDAQRSIAGATASAYLGSQ